MECFYFFAENKNGSAFPLHSTLKTGSGRINAPHGGRNRIYVMPRHKKTPTALSANYLACLKMECITNMEDFFETSKRSGEKRNASPHLTAGELYFELFFKKTDKIVFERRILSFSAGGENFPLNPDGFCSVHKMVCLAFLGRKTAAISRVAKQTILMRRAQKNEQERQPIFVLHAIKHGYDGHKKSPNSL